EAKVHKKKWAIEKSGYSRFFNKSPVFCLHHSEDRAMLGSNPSAGIDDRSMGSVYVTHCPSFKFILWSIMR
ncbi:MAG: hypothetical protein J7K15_09115, partial [Deltaproteobacteria bacterium]|nr:hypothetical protein [Deltaproteobacteria bacterium]